MEIVSQLKCSGCHACFNICPKNAIEMIPDKYGFLYPNIKEDICIHCNLCTRVCPALNSKEKKNNIHAYACINQDDTVRLNSSSGGIFHLLAKNILLKNGVVFGARFNEKFEVVHDYIQTVEDIKDFQGSKYVQSTIKDSYRKAKQFLEDKRMVLFTGTPCQIEGLLCYLQKDYSNLITQDIICHGVPSPSLYRIYKEYIQNSYEDNITKVNFRDKSNGWKKYEVSIELGKKHYQSNHDDDIYIKAFLSDIALRESCYQCHAKKKNRLSDLTLADFWGIENILPNFDDDKGTSLVIINSPAGYELFNEIKGSIVYQEVNYEQAISYNPSIYQSVNRPKKRDMFLCDVDKENLITLTQKYTKKSIIHKLIKKIHK